MLGTALRVNYCETRCQHAQADAFAFRKSSGSGAASSEPGFYRQWFLCAAGLGRREKGR
jgi:hypothetical protein